MYFLVFWGPIRVLAVGNFVFDWGRRVNRHVTPPWSNITSRIKSFKVTNAGNTGNYSQFMRFTWVKCFKYNFKRIMGLFSIHFIVVFVVTISKKHNYHSAADYPFHNEGDGALPCEFFYIKQVLYTCYGCYYNLH